MRHNSKVRKALRCRRKALKSAIVGAEQWVSSNVPQPRMSRQLCRLCVLYTHVMEGM